jgi:hypothetical protein
VKKATQTLVVLLAGLLMALGNPTAAHAEFEPTPLFDDPPGLFTEATVTGTGAGLTVSGFVAPPGFNPFAGYPATIPPGSTAHGPAFAGTITIEDRITGRTGLTYCIDLNTATEVGVNYELGEWSEAHVPNLGYVEYILQHYYPTTEAPSSATVSQKAAAVQAAIWFFTDRYVLATTSAIRTLTAAIVADALDNGPSEEPVTPELSVTPAELSAPSTGEIVGPFTVNSDGPARIYLTGVEVFTDPDGENQLHDGDWCSPARACGPAASPTHSRRALSSNGWPPCWKGRFCSTTERTPDSKRPRNSSSRGRPSWWCAPVRCSNGSPRAVCGSPSGSSATERATRGRSPSTWSAATRTPTGSSTTR